MGWEDSFMSLGWTKQNGTWEAESLLSAHYGILNKPLGLSTPISSLWNKDKYPDNSNRTAGISSEKCPLAESVLGCVTWKGEDSNTQKVVSSRKWYVWIPFKFINIYLLCCESVACVHVCVHSCMCMHAMLEEEVRCPALSLHASPLRRGLQWNWDSAGGQQVQRSSCLCSPSPGTGHACLFHRCWGEISFSCLHSKCSYLMSYLPSSNV